MKNKNYWLRRNRRKVTSVAGLLLILLAVSGILYWENYGRERFAYADVIVLTRDVSAGEQIEQAMFGTIKVNKEAAIDNAVTNAAELEGKSAVCFIPAGIQLPRKFFENKDLTPGNGKYILQLPPDWLYAFPQTLRRGDRAYFYAVKIETGNGENRYTGAAPVQNDPKLPEAAQWQNHEGQWENGDGQLQKEEVSKDGQAASQSVYSALVAYVKDSGNREVIDTVAERMDGSAVISRVEIITDDNGYQRLKDLADQGCRFVLMYD